ncbi:hypothetical protein FFLO_06745 [Filobasidium floriforme]|uniref:Uncharacterized protein n=1 Tax=Filobasidium floriforme TaxID=5210 RepID=A0A8K0JEA2_9TREE|nr:hypothetical protein FFLO_06745 [Filobasidium floriforme]
MSPTKSARRYRIRPHSGPCSLPDVKAKIRKGWAPPPYEPNYFGGHSFWSDSEACNRREAKAFGTPGSIRHVDTPRYTSDLLEWLFSIPADPAGSQLRDGSLPFVERGKPARSRVETLQWRGTACSSAYSRTIAERTLLRQDGNRSATRHPTHRFFFVFTCTPTHRMTFVYPPYVREPPIDTDVKRQRMWEKATAGAGITVPVGRHILDRLIEVEEEHRIDDSVSVLKILSYVKDNLRRDGTKYLNEEDIQKALTELKTSPSARATQCDHSVNPRSTEVTSSLSEGINSSKVSPCDV